MDGLLDASSNNRQPILAVRRVHLTEGPDEKTAPCLAIHRLRLQQAPAAFGPVVQLQAWNPPFQVRVDWRAMLPVEFDCSVTAHAVDDATLARLQLWRAEDAGGEQLLLNHTQQQHVVLQQTAEASTGGSSADDARYCAETLFTFTGLQFKESSLMQKRWLVFAVHIPGGALAFLHFKLPTIVLGAKDSTSDRERATALLSDAPQTAAEHLAGFQRQVYKMLQAAGLHRTPSDADLRYLAAQAGYVLWPDGSCTSVASANELALFFEWLQGHLAMLKHCRAAYNCTDPQLICGFGITRQDAEAALTQRPEGTFVLRLGRQAGMLVLSVRRGCEGESSSSTIAHISITRKDLQSLGLEAVVASCKDAKVLLDMQQATCYQRGAVLGAEHQPLQHAASPVRKRVRALQQDPGDLHAQLQAQRGSNWVSPHGALGQKGSPHPTTSTASTSMSSAPTGGNPPLSWAAARWQQQVQQRQLQHLQQLREQQLQQQQLHEQQVVDWQRNKAWVSAAATLALAALRTVSQGGVLPTTPHASAEKGGRLQLALAEQLGNWPSPGSSQPLTGVPAGQQLSSWPSSGTSKLLPAVVGGQCEYVAQQPSQQDGQQGQWQQLAAKEQQQETQWTPQVVAAAAAVQVPTLRRAFPGALLNFGPNTTPSPTVAPHHSVLPPPGIVPPAGQGGRNGHFVLADGGGAARSCKLPSVWPQLQLRPQGSGFMQPRIGTGSGMETAHGAYQLEPARTGVANLSLKERSELSAHWPMVQQYQQGLMLGAPQLGGQLRSHSEGSSGGAAAATATIQPAQQDHSNGDGCCQQLTVPVLASPAGTHTDDEMVLRVASLEDALPSWEELTEGLRLELVGEDPSTLILEEQDEEQQRRQRRRKRQ